MLAFQSDLPESYLLLNSGNVNTVLHLQDMRMYPLDTPVL